VKIVETNAFMWLIRWPLNALGNFFDFFTLRKENLRITRGLYVMTQLK
jgi:hypothetical protein